MGKINTKYAQSIKYSGKLVWQVSEPFWTGNFVLRWVGFGRAGLVDRDGALLVPFRDGQGKSVDRFRLRDLSRYFRVFGVPPLHVRIPAEPGFLHDVLVREGDTRDVEALDWLLDGDGLWHG